VSSTKLFKYQFCLHYGLSWCTRAM